MVDLSSTSNISTSDEDDIRLLHDTKKEVNYEPVNNVLGKRITRDGVVQYYINWKNNHAKEYNSWVNECDLSSELRRRPEQRRFRTYNNNNMNMMRTKQRKKSEIRPIKVINNKEDWLSYYNVFNEAIKKPIYS